MGLSGRVPPRVDAATKSGLLDLLEQAAGQGWTCAGLPGVEASELRIYRWLHRRAVGELADQAPGGSPMHGLLDWEVAEIIGLFGEWGEIDRSHRKLAHRGSYLERVWVSPASVRRVLAREGLRLRPLPRPGQSVRQPFPDWVEYTPNSIWIYDTTHFTHAGVAATVVEDLVSRKWLAELVAVHQDGLVDPTGDDPARPVLLAMSDIHAEWRADRTAISIANSETGHFWTPEGTGCGQCSACCWCGQEGVAAQSSWRLDR